MHCVKKRQKLYTHVTNFIYYKSIEQVNMELKLYLSNKTTHTNMPVLLFVGTECTLAASQAATW